MTAMSAQASIVAILKVVLKLSSEERKDKRDGNNTMFTNRC